MQPPELMPRSGVTAAGSGRVGESICLSMKNGLGQALRRALNRRGGGERYVDERLELQRMELPRYVGSLGTASITADDATGRVVG